ncbi:MAG TPA: efflux RND transporter periplasmic adaptor subunit [Bryobacteraceae bacterium]|jgi:RND family efflux transporter MFP subunit|nr:efflux RND transporter periplasmic adaptor subunit [Bryobacteraceae bacterium]
MQRNLKLFCGVLPLLLGSCTGSSSVKDVKAADPPSVQVVAVSKIAAADLTREIVLTGEFRPYQVIDLHAKVAGYLKKINVDVGDRIQAGQLIATLEIPEMNDELAHAAATVKRGAAEVQRAQRELQNAETSRKLAELSYTRLANVNKNDPGLVAQQELDVALARQQSAEQQVAAAQAALASAEQQVEISRTTEQRARTMNDYTRITAPFAGVITRRFADTGAMIQAGTASQSQAMPVVRLAQIDRLRLIIPVPESLVPRIHLGAPVMVRVTALGKSFPGTVSRFSKDVLLATKTMETEIDVPNPGWAMTPGMNADVVLTLEKRDHALTTPVQSLTMRDGARFVMVVNPDGTIEERQVKIGIETPAKVEVLSGVKLDEMVIVGNRSQLRPGQKVEPKIGGVS